MRPHLPSPDREAATDPFHLLEHDAMRLTGIML